MARITDIGESLDFYCTKLGMVEVDRKESESGRFTLIFLAAPGDMPGAAFGRAPLLELTYNWPEENGETEEYNGGRNFGHLAFEVENIYQTCQSLSDTGITINRPPKDGRMAFIKSPDNISIELLQKGEPLPPSKPWNSMENIGDW